MKTLFALALISGTAISAAQAGDVRCAFPTADDDAYPCADTTHHGKPSVEVIYQEDGYVLEAVTASPTTLRARQETRSISYPLGAVNNKAEPTIDDWNGAFASD
ncbi:MAG TPA: hypothetical protein VFO41_08850 [Alphaproteobacteria bacterium]|nr:hypothetical protein [Alphaproteobacteria bacterium]